MDFYKIKERSAKNGVIEVYPDFIVCRSKDLMVRGRSFYAIWDEEKGLWSTDEYDVQRLIDKELYKYAEQVKSRNEGIVQVKALGDFSTNSWMQFRNYIGHISDSSHQLDEKLTFSNTEVRKTDYVSRKLQYPLQSGNYSSYDELVSVLYEPSERQKLEWAVGSIIAGDSTLFKNYSLGTIQLLKQNLLLQIPIPSQQKYLNPTHWLQFNTMAICHVSKITLS